MKSSLFQKLFPLYRIRYHRFKSYKISQDEINKESVTEKLGRARSTGCSKSTSDSNLDPKSDNFQI